MDLSDMIMFHKSRGAVCAVALSTGVNIEHGVGRVDSDGRIKYFAEKLVLQDYPVSVGVYVCEPDFPRYLSLGKDLASDVLPQLLTKSAKFYGYVTKEPHHDIGSFKQLDEAKNILKPQKGPAK